MTRVSVIIPTYNCKPLLAEAVESVMDQGHTDLEIIVIDDGSTDGTAQAIEPFLPDIQYFWQPNRGAAAARNRGIQISSGEHLVFLDADDLLLPGKLQAQAAFLEENPAVEIVYSDGFLTGKDSSGHERKTLYSKAGMLKDELGEPGQNVPAFLRHNVFPIHAAMVRRRAVVEAGGFDEARVLMPLADWDLWYRLAWKCRFGYLNMVLSEYRVIETGISKDPVNMLKATQYLEDKIEATEEFEALPPALRSDFYFFYGIYALKFKSPRIAKTRFQKALAADASNGRARVAVWLTRAGDRIPVAAYEGFRNLRSRGRLRL